MAGTAPSSIFAARPVATGIAVGVATLVPHPFLPPDLSLSLAAIVMGMVAGVYFGFAVIRRRQFPAASRVQRDSPVCDCSPAGRLDQPLVHSRRISRSRSVGLCPS